MTYKLLAMAPHPTDGTSKYRAFGPLPKMARRAGNIDLIKVSGTVDWTTFEMSDGLFIQRACMPEQVQLCSIAKNEKAPIWADWDDALWCVPRDNPTYGIYNQPAAKQNMESVARMADVITVSTELLKEKMHAFNDNIVVVPNAIDFDLITPQAADLPRNPVVVWRGGHSHVRDLKTHSAAILEAYARFPDWHWCFFGYDPWEMTERMDPKRVRFVPFDSNYPNYMGNLQKMRAALQIVPLHDNEFNRAKSNIAYLEGTVAGSVVLAPAWQEWQNTGCELYEGESGFKTRLFELMSQPLEPLARAANKNLEWVIKNRGLTLMNDLRLGAMKKYMRWTPA